MTIEEQIKFWFDTADKDLIVAESLFKSEHFLWCLFISHLILEKALKGHWVAVFQETPPKIHDLVKLANKISLKLSENDLKILDEMNKFNLETRYPDYKSDMYHICDYTYTLKMFSKIKEIYTWLKSQII